MNPAQEQTPEALSRFLTTKLDNPVVVSFGNARRQVVQCKGFFRDPTGAPITVRLASFFKQAPPEVQNALAQWLRGQRRSQATRRASQVLDAFIDTALAALPPKQRRTSPAEPTGLAHDLTPLFESLHAGPTAEFAPTDFEPRGLPTITWGRRALSKAKRSLQLGCYAEDSHRIRMHTVLDQPAVPSFFLRFVLFHELLHAARSSAGIKPDAEPSTRARRLHHDRNFRIREAAYPDFEAAQAWQSQQVSKLLTSARTGKPFKPVRRSLFRA